MSPVVVNVVVKRGRHAGRLYPARLRSEAELLRVVGLVHQSRCALGLSFRATQGRLEEYGVRASIGSIHAYATQWRCERCREPEPEPGPGTDRSHQGTPGGQLTDGLAQE